MYLVFFHGMEILAVLGGTILGLGVFLGLLAWAFSGPYRAWTVPLIYLMLGFLVTVPPAIWESVNSELFLGLTVCFTFPWSVLLLFLSTWFGYDLGLFWLIPSIVVNSAIVYAIARYQGG